MSSACAPYWDAILELDQYTKDEIIFWKENIDFVKSRFCFLDRKPHVFGFSDASASGCGAVISLDSQHVCHKLWDSSEASKSSTWRELAAIDFAIESFSSVLESSHVKWYTDNQAAAKIVDVGSMKPDLHKLAVKIFGACLRSKIKLEVQWIPRSENEKADFISRLIDVDDWQLTESFFATLEGVWGPHSVDCMATFYNAKVVKFFSRFWNPGSAGVDFFVQSLESENCLVVPPVVLIARVLHYLKIQSVLATLVIPFWPSSSFWPLITCTYAAAVQSYVLEGGYRALMQGRNTNSRLGSKSFRGQVAGIRFDFRSREEGKLDISKVK